MEPCDKCGLIECDCMKQYNRTLENLLYRVSMLIDVDASEKWRELAFDIHSAMMPEQGE